MSIATIQDLPRARLKASAYLRSRFAIPQVHWPKSVRAGRHEHAAVIAAHALRGTTLGGLNHPPERRMWVPRRHPRASEPPTMCMRRAVLVVGWAPAIVRRNGPLGVSEGLEERFWAATARETNFPVTV